MQTWRAMSFGTMTDWQAVLYSLITYRICMAEVGQNYVEKAFG
jgi:hypothetical protein